MERVDGRGRDLRVDARGAHAERRVHGVVVAVDQVMGGAGMLRVLREDLLLDGRGLHVGLHVALVLAGAEERETVERGGVEVIRVFLVQAPHRIGVGAVAIRLLALRVELLDGFEIHLLAVGRRPGEPLGLRRREALQRLHRGFTVALHPERVIVRHRLAPVRHGEAGVRLLRRPKLVGRIRVLEAVQEKQALQEVRHRGGRPRCGKVGMPELGRLCAESRPRQECCQRGRGRVSRSHPGLPRRKITLLAKNFRAGSVDPGGTRSTHGGKETKRCGTCF